MKMEGYTFDENGILIDIASKTYRALMFTVPKGTKGIAAGLKALSFMRTITIEYEDYDNLIKLVNDILTGYIVNNTNYILKGPRLTYDQSKNVEGLFRDYKQNLKYDIHFQTVHDENLLTVETPEYKIEDGILYGVGKSEEIVIPEGTIIVDSMYDIRRGKVVNYTLKKYKVGVCIE